MTDTVRTVTANAENPSVAIWNTVFREIMTAIAERIVIA